MNEWENKRQIIIDKINNKFVTNTKSDSPWLKSQRSDEILLSRIRKQVRLCKANNIEYDTPEKWDKALSQLKLGASSRHSRAILRKMSWENFLDRIKDF